MRSCPFLLSCILATSSCASSPARPPPSADAPSPASSWEPPSAWEGLNGPETPSPNASVEAPQPTPQPTPQPGGSTFAVTKRPIALGSRVRVSMSIGINSLYAIDTPNGAVTTEDVAGIFQRYVIQVLASDHGVARKIRVVFGDEGESRINNGRQRNKPSPVTGKTYFVEATPEGMAVRDPDGNEPPKDEVDAVTARFRGLATPEAFTRALSDTPMPSGQPVPALAEALKDDMRRGLEGRVWFGRVSATPAGSRQVDGASCVVFNVVLQVGVEKPGSKVRMDLRGEMLLRSADGWPASMDLTGPVAVDEATNGVAAQGNGKARLRMGWGYL